MVRFIGFGRLRAVRIVGAALELFGFVRRNRWLGIWGKWGFGLRGMTGRDGEWKYAGLGVNTIGIMK